jgi:hypothetical protein
MFNPHASNIENAIILFGAIAPGFAALYLLLYLLMRMRHRRWRQPVELSLLDIIGDLPGQERIGPGRPWDPPDPSVERLA